jgi:dGTPase
VVDRLENGGEGLDLTYEVRRGILCHTGEDRAETLEGQIIRLADQIAYINHDIDDAMRGGIIYPMDIPVHISQELGFTHGERINTLVADVITASTDRPEIVQSPEKAAAMADLRAFMFEAVYRNPVAKGEESKAQELIRRLFEYYQKDPDKLPTDYQDIRIREGVDRAVCDYIAGMTDNYCMEKYGDAFLPSAWSVK